jgi:4-diphosphocytidyl-2-C-methyl-D-erythritol kinase
MYPRKMGTAWEIFTPAKLNLYLDVLGRRSDGFHELETLMVPIRLFDHLRWEPRDSRGSTDFSLRYHPSTPRSLQASAPPDTSNLVWRAIDLLASVTGREPTGQITLSKRIPAQAGLGGGSSDAAATLVLANAAWQLGYSRRRLIELAAQLGSDVPFFLAGRSAVCRGRGERVEPLFGLPRLDVVVVAPPEGISTAAAFESLDAPPLNSAAPQGGESLLRQLVARLTAGSIAAATSLMLNSLQAVAVRLAPWIARLGTAFASTGCHAHLLTGSGSAYFGVMRSARHARRSAALLSSANLGAVFATATYR